MTLNNEFWQAPASGGYEIDAGAYADDSDGKFHLPVTYYLNKRASLMYWYRNDYANTSAGTQYGGFGSNSNDFATAILHSTGYMYYVSAYSHNNRAIYHNLKTTTVATSNMRAHDQWHQFHIYCPESGTNAGGVYLDGVKTCQFTPNDYADIFWMHVGFVGTGSFFTNEMVDDIGDNHKGPTYMAQFYLETASSPKTNENLHDSGSVIDLTDATDFDLNGTGAENSGEGSGLFMFGAQGTTSSLTANSNTSAPAGGVADWATDGNWALSTDSTVFPFSKWYGA
mgnify:FL=1